ncbi:hypothetical protein [Streptomyces sp. NPDC054838]
MPESLSQDRYDRLALQVESAASRLASALADRLAEHLWLFLPEARSISIVLNDVHGEYELVEVRDAASQVLYRLGDEGVLNSLDAHDAVDRHGAMIDSDAATLGAVLLIGPLPGRSRTSDRYPFGWDVELPELAGASDG